MDFNQLIELIDEGAALAPEATILGLIFTVRETNIKSLRNTASPFIPPWSLLPPEVQQQVTSIATQTGKDVQSVIATASQIGYVINQPLIPAIGSLASLLGL